MGAAPRLLPWAQPTIRKNSRKCMFSLQFEIALASKPINCHINLARAYFHKVGGAGGAVGEAPRLMPRLGRSLLAGEAPKGEPQRGEALRAVCRPSLS